MWECATELRRETERKCVCVCPRGLHNKHCRCEVHYDVFLTLLSSTQMHTYTQTIRCFFCSNSLVSLQVCTAAECQIVFSSQRKAMDLVSGIWRACVDVWVCVSVSCVSAWLHTGAWMSHMVRSCDAIGWCWALAQFLFPLVSRGDWSYRTGVTVLAATVHVCVFVCLMPQAVLPYQVSTHPAMIHPLYVTADAQCPFNLYRRSQCETSQDIYKSLFFC